ncbi:hypothetical protein Q8A67_017989 [Cirrhinus molitorella]|uniref:Uncharacterized protein n=1 Tax=Cirrhinus molitorella TaxID=172907 RepID=A0AA88TE98_9TELE|nr:hypothetical protein Q8A67_017989 [Cirrhinus molitorella]
MKLDKHRRSAIERVRRAHQKSTRLSQLNAKVQRPRETLQPSQTPGLWFRLNRPFKFSNDPIAKTDGEVQRGSEDVGEVKEEYVGQFSRDFGRLMLIKFSYTQAHYGLDRIGHADNVKNESSRGEAEEKSEIKERMKV